jgi:hypothetical protein
MKSQIFVKSISFSHHEAHQEHKDFIEIFISYLFLSKNFNLHRLQINPFMPRGSCLIRVIRVICG